MSYIFLLQNLKSLITDLEVSFSDKGDYSQTVGKQVESKLRPLTFVFMNSELT